MTALLPVTVLTGFLGSGKTTLLRHALAAPQLGDTAVLVNEIGEIALDHELLSEVREDLIVLGSGCICCSVRNDLTRALCELALARDRGSVPPFRRVVIETTGMADPVPLVRTLVKNGLVASRFRLDGVVTTVDAELGLGTIANHPEAGKQVALADRIIVTKCDMASTESLLALDRYLQGYNPLAPRRRSGLREFADLLGHEHTLELSRAAATGDSPPAGPVDVHGVHTLTVSSSAPLDFDRFALWHRMAASVLGEQLLRVKGILDVKSFSHPVVVHSAQHVVYPVAHLEAWRAPPSSRVVLIQRGLDEVLWRDVAASLRGICA